MIRLAAALSVFLVMVLAKPSQSAEPGWTATGDLNTGRLRHTACLLGDGRVLVVAGNGSAPYLTSAELFDPTTGLWTVTGSLAQGRTHHSVAVLGDGRVLVAGGKSSHGGFLSSCELYTPATGTWSLASSMSQAREVFTLTLLNDGRVLATGGQYSHNSPSTSCQLYDPGPGTWQPAASMAVARAGHTATLLTDGRVLVVGGGWGSAPGIPSCEIYDPASDAWSPAASLNQARSIHRAVLLPNGRVLVLGGEDTSWLSSSEIYDPATDTWSNTASLSAPKAFMTATLLGSGRVLVAGGLPGYVATCEIYDPDEGTWSSAISMSQGRTYHTATMLDDGTVLVGGGYCVEGSTDYRLTSCELYSVNTPPVVDAGDNVEIFGADQATTVLTGTASDADGDTLTCRWLEGGVVVAGPIVFQGPGTVEPSTCSLNLGDLPGLAVGVHTFTLEINDGTVAAVDDVIVTIDNSPPTAGITGAGVYEIGPGLDVPLGGQVSDHDGDTLVYQWKRRVPGSPDEALSDAEVIAVPAGGDPVSLPVQTVPTQTLGTGVHTVLLVADDGINDAIEVTMEVEVVDSTAPTLSVTASRSILWPPNHKMVEVILETEATDNSGDPVQIDVTVSSSKPADGQGDGNTEPDYEVLDVDPVSGVIRVNLRSERSGSGDGRTYTITVTATDAAGQSSVVTVEVVAPHSRGKKKG